MSTAALERVARALAPSYVVQQELGAGGMATVYRAEEVALGRVVVIKVLTEQSLDPEAAARFTREIRVAARLQHPNVLPVLAAGDADGIAWYSMPLVAGDSLWHRQQRGPIERPEALRILSDVLRALMHAHAHEVVHRDIKPENVLLSSGVAVVTDFGIAKAIDSARETASASQRLTQAGMSLGTPAYMAPEQALGEDTVDHRADLYSWGLLAYELLSGTHPFAHKRNAAQLIAAQLAEMPKPLDMPESSAIVSIVMRCVAKSVDERPASAAEVLAQFDAHTVRADATPRVGAAGSAAGSRIAVIPFENLSSDADNEYLSDGITEEVLGSLGRHRGMQVMGRASCFALKGQGLDAPAVAMRLGVSHVVAGSVRRAGSRVRVAAELLQADSGYQLWSERYDRELTDVFALQDDIAAAIVSALTATLVAPSAPSRRVVDPEAYELYLQGTHVLRAKQRSEAVAEARALIDRSIAIDAAFAPAHLAKATVLFDAVLWGFGAARTLLPTARSSARAALALDDSLAQAWTIEAHCCRLLDHNWQSADAAMDRALRASSPDGLTLARVAAYSSMRSRLQDASDLCDRAVALDPLNPVLCSSVANTLRVIGRYDDAVALAQSALARHPNDASCLWVLGATLFLAERFDEAAPVAQHARFVAPDSPSVQALSSRLAFVMGDTSLAFALREKLVAVLSPERPVAMWLAYVDLTIGDLDAAAGWVEDAYAHDEFWLPWAEVEPSARQLYTVPRVRAVLDRVHGRRVQG